MDYGAPAHQPAYPNGDHLTLVSDLVSKLKVDGSQRMTAKAVLSRLRAHETHPPTSEAKRSPQTKRQSPKLGRIIAEVEERKGSRGGVAFLTAEGACTPRADYMPKRVARA